MAFHVGQRVVCVDEPSAAAIARMSSYGCGPARYPHKGQVLTIRAINDWPEHTLLRFRELVNSAFEGEISKIEPGFNSIHFRPVKTTETGIAILNSLLTPKLARTRKTERA